MKKAIIDTQTVKLYSQFGVDPFYQCAFEKTLCESSEPFISIFTTTECVMAGRDITYANHYVENNKLNVPFVRYMGTGGPVYINSEFIKITGLLPKNSFTPNTACRLVADIYTRLGIKTDYVEGTNDIKIQGKKVSGVSYSTQLGDNDFFAFFFSLSNDYKRAAQVMKLTKHTTVLSERAAGIHETHPSITKEQIIEAVKLELQSRGFNLKDVDVNTNKTLLTRVEENESEIFRNQSFIKYGILEK